MFFPGAAVYMDKIAVGPEAVDVIDIDAPPPRTSSASREAKGMRAERRRRSSCSSATATRS